MCLLFGPHLACIPYGKSRKTHTLEEVFALHLAEELEADEVSFSEELRNNLFYIAHKHFVAQNDLDYHANDAGYEIQEAYPNLAKEIPPIYHQLAQLPFHLIINTSPDDFMFRALEQHPDKTPSFCYYNFDKNQDASQIPATINADEPLVYNLFGSVEEPNSLILTEQQQLRFVKKIVQNKPEMPAPILSRLQKVSCLFFEFNLEDWHFRILLEGLDLKPAIRTFSPKYSRFNSIPLTELTKTFYDELC